MRTRSSWETAAGETARPEAAQSAAGRLEMRGAGVRRPGGAGWAVRGVDLVPRPGEVLCLVGANAAGKSSVLRLLSGLWRCDEGVVRLDGREVARADRRWVASRVAYLAQGTPALVDFTVAELVALGRYPLVGRLPGRARDAHWLDPLLERMDLSSLAGRLVTELSGGELQRTLLARALAGGARTLLLDEPIASLDLAHALEVVELARELAQGGATVVLALHELDLAWRYADRVAVLRSGSLLAVGPPHEVLTSELIRTAFDVESERVRGAHGEGLWFRRRS